MPFVLFTVPDTEISRTVDILKGRDIVHSGGTPTTDGILYVELSDVKEFLQACEHKGIHPEETNPTYDYLSQL